MKFGGRGMEIQWLNGRESETPSFAGPPGRILLERLEKKGAHMTNEEKHKCIRHWLDPEERITVNFLDVRDRTPKSRVAPINWSISPLRRTCPI